MRFTVPLWDILEHMEQGGTEWNSMEHHGTEWNTQNQPSLRGGTTKQSDRNRHSDTLSLLIASDPLVTDCFGISHFYFFAGKIPRNDDLRLELSIFLCVPLFHYETLGTLWNTLERIGTLWNRWNTWNTPPFPKLPNVSDSDCLFTLYLPDFS